MCAVRISMILHSSTNQGVLSKGHGDGFDLDALVEPILLACQNTRPNDSDKRQKWDYLAHPCLIPDMAST